MKPLKAFLIYTFILTHLLFAGACSGAGVNNNPASAISLVGSTPGDAVIKSLLSIPPAIPVDFIRWDLTLHNKKSDQNTFVLNLVFGEAQPNTLGFKNGGEKRAIEGTYRVSRSKDEKRNRDLYHLKSSQLPAVVSMVKLNDNLFHLLTPENQLMKGNGGWSYTLNRKPPMQKAAAALPALTSSAPLLGDTARQTIFEGRTPCLAFARENKLPVAADCMKLKWLLLLNKDPKTLLPSTYMLKRSDSRSADITGKWAIVTGIRANPDVILYQLDPDKPEKSVSFLVGDENVIFLLNKANQLYVGNSNFSYTLNKREE